VVSLSVAARFGAAPRESDLDAPSAPVELGSR
jgi:hypothetical protein